jgi:integral membrane protein
MKKFFRVLTFLEGVSNVLLILVAVPIKYFLNNEFLVKLLGMPHGLLFVAYCIMAILMIGQYKWNFKTLSIVLLASIIPFGTFWVDKKYLR